MNLTERQEIVLRTLVEDYVTSGHPVASETLLERSGLNVSSATIRSELSLLEDLGLAMQLHVSGGRIPTTTGYRYYIEHLLPTSTLTDDDQVTIRHQFHQSHSELEEWLKLAAAVMAHRARNVALVTSPRLEEVGFKRVELVESAPHTALIILVLRDGSVLQEAMSTEETLSQDELRRHADVFNGAFGQGSSINDLHRIAHRLPEPLRPYGDEIVRMLSRARERRLQIYHQGLGEMLTRPEFSPNAHPNLAVGERLRRVVDFLQQGLAMEDLLSVVAMENGVQVLIGGEAPLLELEDYSMVVGRYGAGSEGSGVLGVLGPQRMDYGRAISLVRYMSELMSDVVFGGSHRDG